MRALPRMAALWVLLLSFLTASLIAFSLPRIPQWPEYHQFAATEELFGIAHFQNVVTSIAFCLVGLWGFIFVLTHSRFFGNRLEQTLWTLFFLFTILVGVGSSIYHNDPTNDTLVWDRGALILVITSLFSALLTEQVGWKIGAWASPFLLLLALWSVAIWWVGEQVGRGDLRLYGLMQFYPFAGVWLLYALFPRRYLGWHWIGYAMACYIVGKLFEFFDSALYEFSGGLASGHAVKHLFAAVSVACVLRYVAYRKPSS